MDKPKIQGSIQDPYQEKYYGLLSDLIRQLNVVQRQRPISGSTIDMAVMLKKLLRLHGSLMFDQEGQLWTLHIETEEHLLILDGV